MLSSKSGRLNRTVRRRFVEIFCLAVLGTSGHSIAVAISYPVFNNNTLLGDVTIDPLDSGAYGGFTSYFGSPPSLAAAAQLGSDDHFNWFQVIIADNDAPNNVHGVKQVPPYIDPPLGGYGAPDTHWADGLPWLWDEGADPPAGTPGFSDGYNIKDDVFQDVSPVDGVADTLLFDDVPGGATGSSVTFQTWLVSLGANGSLHEFLNGFQWSWSNPLGGDGTSVISPQPLTAANGLAMYQQLVFPDYNQNGIVDAADYTVWRDGLGTDYTSAGYAAWRTHFGQTAGSGSGENVLVAVPEPATGVMLIVGMLVLVARCRPATNNDRCAGSLAWLPARRSSPAVRPLISSR